MSMSIEELKVLNQIMIEVQEIEALVAKMVAAHKETMAILDRQKSDKRGK